jgi:hypothetical protein
MIYKSDIISRVLSEMPLFYTTEIIRNISMLQVHAEKIRTYAVKHFRDEKIFFYRLKFCA